MSSSGRLGLWGFWHAASFFCDARTVKSMESGELVVLAMAACVAACVCVGCAVERAIERAVARGWRDGASGGGAALLETSNVGT